MACDKNDIVITDQNAIVPALNWYKNHRKGDHFTAATFYSGRIYYSSGDYPEAIICFQQAGELAESTYWKAMAASHMGITYNRCYNNEEELNLCLEALALWEEYGDEYRIQQAISSLASAYNNNRFSDKADSLLELLCTAEVPYKPAFRQRAELKIRHQSPNYKEIASLFETGMELGCAMSLDDWYEYAYALFKCGNTARAKSIVNQLSSYGESISSCLWLGRIAEEEGDYKLALEYERTEKQLTDTIVKNQLSQSLFKAQTEQYKLTSELAKQKRDYAILFAVLITLLLSSVILWMAYSFQARRKRLEREKDQVIEIAEKTSEMLRQAQLNCHTAETKSIDSEAKLQELRGSFARMYQHQFSEIGRLFDYNSSTSDLTEKAAKKYLQKTTEIMGEINGGEESQREFEDRINQDLDNIMQKLRLDFPNFTEYDFRFLSYVIVGFDATTRAIILNETPNNMRVKKTRLLKKIANSNTENSLLYSCFLHPDR